MSEACCTPSRMTTVYGTYHAVLDGGMRYITPGRYTELRAIEHVMVEDRGYPVFTRPRFTNSIIDQWITGRHELSLAELEYLVTLEMHYRCEAQPARGVRRTQESIEWLQPVRVQRDAARDEELPAWLVALGEEPLSQPLSKNEIFGERGKRVPPKKANRRRVRTPRSRGLVVAQGWPVYARSER